MIVLLQATHMGPPMIYYGTEAGMWGADDPDDRMPMVWDDMEFDVQAMHPFGRPRPADSVSFDRDLFDFYRRAFSLRRQHVVLRRGDFSPVGTSDAAGAFAFIRSLGDEEAIVVMNRSDGPGRVTIVRPDGWTEATLALSSSSDADVRITENSGTFSVDLEPLTGALLVSSTLRDDPTGRDG